MSTIVENTNPVTVDIEPKYSVTTQSGAIVENKAPEYSVSVQRKEYKVVGDNIYIPKLYDDAPQWMKDLVNTVVDVKTAVAVGNLDDALEALRTLSDELEVAKNTYTNSIISSNDIDKRINTAIETLNSALSDADATIMNIAQTAVTPAEASAIAINTLSASLSASGEIGSFIANMNSAFADLDSTTTQSINFMESAINAEFSANATALNTIRTYVGIDGDGNETGTGLAEAITQLGVDIANEAGLRAAGDTTVTNTVKAYADSVGAGVESKWEYGSVLGINGIYKKSGFGLTTNYTSGAGTEANPYVSEFWIDATKLRFTNSNQTGRVAPFTIDATGATPEITFNGKVAFTNVKGYEDDVVSKIKQGKNLIYEDWSVGTGSTAKYIINGLVSENSRVIGDNHLGNRVPLWVCIPDSVNDADGGWNTTLFGIDKNKSYRFSVFVKTTTATGSTFFGCGWSTVTDLNTSTVNNNPYFWAGDLPVQDRWYLIVGYVHPVGQTGITSQGGVYDCTTGAKVAGTTDFNWSSSALNSLHRCYHFYNTDVNTRQYMWNPRVDLVDGNEPSILDMIGISAVSGSITSNNDVFAQRLGYANYAAMVAAASSGQTIINGGYINTSLIQATSVLANDIMSKNITYTGTITGGNASGGGIIQSYDGKMIIDLVNGSLHIK